MLSKVQAVNEEPRYALFACVEMEGSHEPVVYPGLLFSIDEVEQMAMTMEIFGQGHNFMCVDTLTDELVLLSVNIQGRLSHVSHLTH